MLYMMQETYHYVDRVAEHFKQQLGPSLVEVYRLGSLAHGGFSRTYSDIDVGVILNCVLPPSGMEQHIADAKALNEEYGQKLSVFWGNPEYAWGRLPVIDKLDLLDHGVPVLNNIKIAYRRPAKAAIHSALCESLEKNYVPKLDELTGLRSLEPQDRKPFIRSILYPARLIYSWDCLGVSSNDDAVEYVQQVEPPELDLKPIEMALACRYDRCVAEDVFALKPDLKRQFESATRYISARP